MIPNPPISEAELHALVDGQLTLERAQEAEAWLANRPDEAQRVQAYRTQKHALRAMFDPVLHEPLPQRVGRAAQPRTSRLPRYGQRLAAGIAIVLVGGAAGWGLRGSLSAGPDAPVRAQRGRASIKMAVAVGFAQRAAVAHAVYSPEGRRPVEVDAAHEDQLVALLSK